MASAESVSVVVTFVPESAPHTSRMARTGPARSPRSAEFASQFTCSSSNPTSDTPESGLRWKGRAFQQSPDSGVSLVGFEDEQVNWEANSALLGERAGPVRAIREVWGADSGTNVTTTETLSADAITYRYHLRVHPIPPDGLYTSSDYNRGVAASSYNAVHPRASR